MAPETSPTARALRALEVIQAGPGVRADQLAKELGVSERAARRYVGILREAEIPILATRGRYGGYTVGRGVRLPPLTFTATEALGMVMAVLDGHHDAADTADPVGNALRKIMRALPETVAAQAEALRRTARLVPEGEDVSPDPSTTAVLVQACAAHHLVRLGYRSEAGAEWVSTVEPWAVVVRHGRWYLLCRRSGGGIRTYRLDRVRSVEQLEERYVPPADLDPVAMLEENLAAGWEFPTEVVIEAPLEQVSWLPRAIGRLEPIDEHSCRLLGTTSSPDWYAEALAALPVPFRIVSGPQLQAAARALGRRMLAAAGDPAGAGTAGASGGRPAEP